MAEFIPKILHQVWISKDEVDENKSDLEQIPEKWRHCSARYKELCKENGWEYRVWTTTSARKLIETEYSWFLQQYDAYEYVIQRADTIRYFLLHKYGGIYSDLDIKPKANFFSLYEMYKSNDIVLASTCTKNSFGSDKFINGFLMSKPDSPFWPIVWKHLQAPGQTTWYKPMLSKVHYFKILFTTGPGIISDAAKEYGSIATIPFQLIQPQRTAQHKDVISTPESVVELYEGESWQQKDANVWRAIGDVANNTQWILLGFVIAFAVVILYLLFKMRSMKKTFEEQNQSKSKSKRKTWD